MTAKSMLQPGGGCMVHLISQSYYSQEEGARSILSRSLNLYYFLADQVRDLREKELRLTLRVFTPKTIGNMVFIKKRND